jgi:hypothetical protein
MNFSGGYRPIRAFSQRVPGCVRAALQPERKMAGNRGLAGTPFGEKIFKKSHFLRIFFRKWLEASCLNVKLTVSFS